MTPQVLNELHEGLFVVDRLRRIQFWNRSAEGLTGYRDSEVVGAVCAQGPLSHVDESGCGLCNNRCLLERSIQSGQVQSGEAYLRHRSGHRIPVSIRVAPLVGEEGQVTGAVQMFAERVSDRLERERIAELVSLAMLDPLTLVGNRRAVEHYLLRNLSEAGRHGVHFGLFIADVDRLKDVNDLYGHDVGDSVLMLTARTLINCLRTSDFVGRWGGDEFVALLPGAGAEGLIQVAERCRAVLAQTVCPVGNTVLRLSASFGTTMSIVGDSAEAILKRAGRAAYRSKRGGGNRLTVDGPFRSSPASAAPDPSPDPGATRSSSLAVPLELTLPDSQCGTRS